MNFHLINGLTKVLMNEKLSIKKANNEVKGGTGTGSIKTSSQSKTWLSVPPLIASPNTSLVWIKHDGETFD